MAGVPQVPCTVCGEQGDRTAKCWSLIAPLQPGFSSEGGGHRHQDEGEEESIYSLHDQKRRRLECGLYQRTPDSYMAMLSPKKRMALLRAETLQARRLVQSLRRQIAELEMESVAPVLEVV